MAVEPEPPTQRSLVDPGRGAHPPYRNYRSRGGRRGRGGRGGQGIAASSQSRLAATSSSIATVGNLVSTQPPQAATTQPATTEPLPTGTDTQEGAETVEAEVCFICASPVVHQSIAPCNHRTCHICGLRMRALYKNRDCAHCRVRRSNCNLEYVLTV